ncbi:hypothetical protein K8T06_17445 [bacterium]|nr:hypothetical protein [bacterium]
MERFDSTVLFTNNILLTHSGVLGILGSSIDLGNAMDMLVGNQHIALGSSVDHGDILDVLPDTRAGS